MKASLLKPFASAVGCLLVFLTTSPNSHAATLAVAMARGLTNEVLHVPIQISNAAPSAAAFTLTFDTAALDVQVDSPFFGSFADQYAQSGAFDPYATTAEVEGHTYSNAFLVVPLPGQGLAMAGLRRLRPASSNETLLTLRIALRHGAAPGLYDLNLQPTTVNLATAGFDPGGEPLDLLVGRNRLDDSYSVLLTAAGSAAHLVPGYVQFDPGDPDTDNDGLPDEWELQHFGDLTSANDTTDTDGDGLIDIVECFMGTDPNQPDNNFLVRAEKTGDIFSVYFPMRTGHGLELELEWSNDLNTWSGDNITLTPRPDLGGGPDWSITQASVPTNGADMMVMRLNLRRE